MITQKQQAVIIIALANFAREAHMLALQRGSFIPKIDNIKTFQESLENVEGAAMILTDEELFDLSASAMKLVLDMQLTDVKIIPQMPETATLQ